MDIVEDARWKQRFSNFEKAFNKLTEYTKKNNLNELEIQGLIQCFEYTFELGWKTMKDYIEEKGAKVSFPRDVIQTAFQSELIINGHAWLDALDKRNLMSHTYNEEISNQVYQLIITEYYSMLKELYNKFKFLQDMQYGLTKQDLSYIVNTIKEFKEIEKAIIFGSRAKGNYKQGSDVDLAIVGDNINIDVIGKLTTILKDNSPIPYLFDIVDYTHLDHMELKEHIDRVGKVIFERS